MRSKIILLFVLTSSILNFSFGQKKNTDIEVFSMPIDEYTNLITYQNVITMKASPSELYERARKWAEKYYANPTRVIKTADSLNHVLVCKSNIKIHTLSKDGKTSVMAGVVSYKLRIEAKNDRYRYTFTDFVFKGGNITQNVENWLDSKKPEWTEVRNEHLREIDMEIKKAISAIEEGMQAEKLFKDEW